jgi:hypothetical protein
MFESVAGLLTALRQTSPAIFLGIAIASGTIIFSSEDLALRLGVEDFRKQFRGYIGGTFIAAVSVLGSFLLFRTYKLVQDTARDYRKAAREYREKARRIEQLHNLTLDEKACLEPYILLEETTLYFKLGDGLTQQPLGKKIVFQASEVGSMLSGFAYNMQPWAKDYLAEHQELLEGANPNPRGPPKY